MQRTGLLVAILALGATLAPSAAIFQGQSAQGQATTQVATQPVSALLAEAQKLLAALEHTAALALVERAMSLAERAADRVGLAQSYRHKANVLRQMNKASESVSWNQRALSEFEALGNQAGIADALSGLVASLSQLRDNRGIREYADRALKLYEIQGNDRGRAFVLINLIRSDESRELDASRIGEVLAIGTRLGDDSLLGTGFSLQASRQFTAGNLSGAKTSYEQASAALERGGDAAELASTYLSLGRVFRAHGDYDGALQRYQQAIDLLAPTKERYTIVEATNAKGIALSYLGRYKESLATYEQGLALARESDNQALIDFMEANVAGGLLNTGEYDRAIAILEAAIAKKPDANLLGYRLGALARALTAVGRTNQAADAINEAIRLTRELKQTDNLRIRLNSRAEILSKLGRYPEALADARESLGLVEDLRARLIPSDFLKRGFGEHVQASYVRIVDLLSRLGRPTEALESSEQGRARAFLDLLASRAGVTTLVTRGEGREPPIAPGRELASDAMGQPADLSGIRQIAARLGSTLLAFWAGDDATLIWVIRPGAEPTHVRVPVGREKLNALVASTTAPLRETAKAIDTRGAERAEPAANAQATAEDLAALPMRGLGLLALSRDDKAAWRELYQTLIEPVRSQLPARGGRITVVPHGPLLQLSFAALRSGTGRYLIEDYELHYAPAISALEYTSRRQGIATQNAKGPWAIVGNPSTLPMVGGRSLPPLPGAAREVASIASLGPRGNVVRFDGARADEAGLAAALDTSHPSVLHFATHGFVFSDPKQAPFLALNRRGTTDADDGRLTLDEVYGLRLTTDLVVLSACRSGSGQVSSDGVLGLTRGFFYAGSPSVLATFWDVVDEATANLMSGFYRRYAPAHAKASSLRAAQLALLADLRAGKVVVTGSGRRVTLPEHPLLWAAFFLSGEP
jgi:CHAT domain-containing protein/tetratricopeptide (TPR) repeat protein